VRTIVEKSPNERRGRRGVSKPLLNAGALHSAAATKLIEQTPTALRSIAPNTAVVSCDS
jgi:hypothetical protein